MKKHKLEIKKKTKFMKVVKQKDEKDITALLNKRVGHLLDEHERQDQEIQERLKEEKNQFKGEEK
jgi:hypothetical protein